MLQPAIFCLTNFQNLGFERYPNTVEIIKIIVTVFCAIQVTHLQELPDIGFENLDDVHPYFTHIHGHKSNFL